MSVVLNPGEVRALNGVVTALLRAHEGDLMDMGLDATECDALRLLQSVLLDAQRPGYTRNVWIEPMGSEPSR